MVKCVGDMAQDEKMSWNTTKTNSGCNFQNTKFLGLVQTSIFTCTEPNVSIKYM